jgi:tetratricopeptide (TPR) repeat protein
MVLLLASGATAWPNQGSAELVREAMAGLSSPDASVRESSAILLGRADLAGVRVGERALALERLAESDPRESLRRLALQGLANLGAKHGAPALARLAATLPATEASRAAKRLTECVGTPEVLFALLDPLVRDGLGPLAQAPATAPEVLAVLLPAWGRLLADRSDGGLTAAERSPLTTAIVHPHPAVRAAADRAFRSLVDRFMARGEAERGLVVLTALGREGLDPRMTSYHIARLALAGGLDPQEVLAAARSIGRAAERGVDGGERLWTFRALYLEGMGELAGGEPARARMRFRAAAAALARLLSLREDLGDAAPPPGFEEALHHRSLVHLATVVALLAEGAPRDDPTLIMQAREAHLYSLLYQAENTRSGGSSGQGWDSVLSHELGPTRLLVPRDRSFWSAQRLRNLSVDLGSILASMHAVEMPGFRPSADSGAGSNPGPFTDPLLDAQRMHALRGILLAEIEQLQRVYASLWERLRLSPAAGGARDMVGEARLAQLRARLNDRLRTELMGPVRAAEEFRKLRVPSSLALRLARDLRAAGELDEARALVRALSEDLEASGHHREMLWGLELEAEVDLMEGAILTDAGEPELAEEFLERAVERLLGLERLLVERSAGTPRMLRGLRNRRCDALISLAVNANVVLGEPERALAYFERAHALRQDDFTIVLLACYRARSGRSVEARQILDSLRPSPATYYNLACTWALLGEKERALFFLERDLAENHGGPSARNRQKDWARRDPDLASLWGDVRFEEVLLTE